MGLYKMKILYNVKLTLVAWTAITFFGDSTKLAFDKETNETMVVEIPRLMIKAWYPWNSMTGMTYMISLGYQV